MCLYRINKYRKTNMKYLLLFIAIPTILFSQLWDNTKWENYDFYKDNRWYAFQICRIEVRFRC